MKIKNRTRYIIIIVFSLVMNIGGSFLAQSLHLPLWFDFSGTVFAAMLLEPAAGLVVGLIDNFYLAIFSYGSSSIIYFVVSAAIALIVGCYLRKDDKICRKRIPLTALLLVVVTTLLSFALSFWKSGGVPNGECELYFYNLFCNMGIQAYLSNLFAIAVIKVFDVIATGVVISIIYLIMPKFLKYPTRIK